MRSCQLLDERGRPDVRAIYGRLARRADRVDAAVGRVRLGGMTLDEGELGGTRRVRLLMTEMNALTFNSEAESMAADPERGRRLRFIVDLLRRERLSVRIAPLAGWTPDFSVFTRERRDDGERTLTVSATLLLGPHWFERPYPHPGPAFTAVMGGEPALRALGRFEELWDRAHDLRRPLLSLIEAAIRRGDRAPRTELTSPEPSGLSLPMGGFTRRIDPV